jgi:hypothetical protein
MQGMEVRMDREVRLTVATAVLGLLSLGGVSTPRVTAGDGVGPQAAAPPSLEETRLTMGKWIETQQIISTERNDWSQGKEILLGRLELVKKEIATLEEAIAKDQAAVAEANAKRDELKAENAQLEAANAQLTQAASGLEGQVREIHRRLPAPLQTTLAPLFERMPVDSAATKVSAAERFQNVLGILDAVNKANNEISVSYEVRTLADGAPSEVKALYIGLAQAYYVSARGEAGTGRPGPDGWTWEPSAAIGADVAVALEILEGKHTPAFVPLPVTLQ